MPCSSCCTPAKESQELGGSVGLGAGWERCGNLIPHFSFNPTIQPITGCYTNYTIPAAIVTVTL